MGGHNLPPKRIEEIVIKMLREEADTLEKCLLNPEFVKNISVMDIWSFAKNSRLDTVYCDSLYYALPKTSHEIAYRVQMAVLDSIIEQINTLF
jgi:non-homologous end joining protein Ku